MKTFETLLVAFFIYSVAPSPTFAAELNCGNIEDNSPEVDALTEAGLTNLRLLGVPMTIDPEHNNFATIKGEIIGWFVAQSTDCPDRFSRIIFNGQQQLKVQDTIKILFSAPLDSNIFQKAKTKDVPKSYLTNMYPDPYAKDLSESVSILELIRQFRDDCSSGIQQFDEETRGPFAFNFATESVVEAEANYLLKEKENNALSALNLRTIGAIRNKWLVPTSFLRTEPAGQ